jgi:tetratricopeptide (TPR) repeat protein
MGSSLALPQQAVIRSFVLAVALTATPARAFADAKADAKEHIAKASAAHDAGKLDVALAELNIAYTLDPQPDLLYAIAQVHVQLGQCPLAITFYKRFLATHPSDDAVAVVNEAIHTCETKPPPAIEAPPPEPVAAPPPQPAPIAPAPVAIAVDQPAFYTDVIGDVLVGAGLVAGIAGVVEYASARSALGDADHASTYAASQSLVDSAHTRRDVSLGLGVGGAVLIGAGVVHYVLHRREAAGGVAIAPAHGGGVVTWSGRF